MPFSLQTLSLLGLVLAIVLQYDLLRPSRKTLPSLSQHPSELYPPDFYNGGHYLTLPLGTMRYWEFGPSNGKRVVLIHGISTGSSTYDKVGRHLVSDSMARVLSNDLCYFLYDRQTTTIGCLCLTFGVVAIAMRQRRIMTNLCM